jgi:hypothetical protein
MPVDEANDLFRAMARAAVRSGLEAVASRTLASLNFQA